MPADPVLVISHGVELVPRSDWPLSLQGKEPIWSSALTNPRGRTSSVLLDMDADGLLEQFARPCRVSEALAVFAESRGVDPLAMLDGAVPLLEELLRSGFLRTVDDTSSEPSVAAVEPGTLMHGWSVVRPVRELDDTAVYEVCRDGHRAAMKIARTAHGWQRHALAHEVAVLEALDVDCVPRVLEPGLDASEPYAVLEWREGVHVTEAAATLRRRPLPGSRMDVLDLLAAVARTYARLHAAGALHGDVQPRNVLATSGPSPTVSIVDLGFAELRHADALSRLHPRGGVEGYQAPELIVDGETRWLTTELSEQYALGCLLFELATGAFPFDRSVSAHTYRASCGTSPARRFSEVGTRGWDALDDMLSPCLAPDPADRYHSVAHLADALETLRHETRRYLEPIPWSPLHVPLEPSDHGEGEAGPLTPPLASVNYGAAGVAYAYYRRGRADRDGRLVATALLWAEAATGLVDHPDSFTNPLLGITPSTVGESGLYHSALGVHLVEAVVAHDADERWAPALTRFVDAAQSFPESADLVSGRAGQLLGCCLALATVRGEADPVVARLCRLGDRLLQSLGNPVPRLTADVPGIGQPFVGIAHGWAGVAYSIVLWCRLRGRDLPTWTTDVLAALVEASVDVGDGKAAWPRLSGGDRGTPWAGWCHGSAGHAMLLCAVGSLLGGEWVRLAEAAAAYANNRAAGLSLCCGSAGIAYANLALYRSTGKESWLDQARRLAVRGRALATAEPQGLRKSLYKGSLVLDVLAADLTRPAESIMPLFEVTTG